jgi:hypothetical protein
MRGEVAGRRSGGLALFAATAVGVVALAVNAAAGSAASSRSESQSASGAVRATLRITAPAPAQKVVTSTPPPNGGGPQRVQGAAEELKGTFSISGAVRDRGSLVMGPPARAGSSPVLSVELRGSRGSLRLSLSPSGSFQRPDGTAEPTKGTWRITSGTRAYAGLRGSGEATLSPQLILLVGAVRSR